MFPEGGDPRIQEAAMELATSGLADPLLLGTDGQLGGTLEMSGMDPRAIRVADPADPERVERYAAELRTLKRFRVLDDDEVRQRASDPLIQGALMVRMGEVQGSVAGAAHTRRGAPGRNLMRGNGGRDRDGLILLSHACQAFPKLRG